ncbi:hypothetical protein [Actinocorallia aurantiaca]|uniref:hypothetical protein n=1 Tax=Actinocorallia aurantiaca TaxID=46204 RepID=UPI0031DCAB95
MAAALEWVAGASRPVADLAEAENLRGLLDALFQRLDGKPLAHTSARARRAVLYGCLDYAVERKLLSSTR